MNTGAGQHRRVLVVLPNWLGDLVMACPLLDLLAAARDETGRSLTLTACVRRRWAPLLTRDPRLSGLIPYERTGRHAGLAGLVRLASAWRQADFCAVVLCPPSLRMGLVAWLAGIPLRVGESRDGRGLMLTCPLAPVKPRGSLHHSEELRRLGPALLTALGLPVPAAATNMPRLPGLRQLAAAHPGSGPPLWIIAPGATYGPAKTWPVARLAEFLNLAVGEQARRVVLVGDTAAAATTAELQRRTPQLLWRRELAGPAAVIDLIGATTVIDLTALFKSAEAFLGNDSGAMHLAAALEVPTLGLFGSSSAAWTGPRGLHARALAADGFACQPCFRKTCNQPRFCLDTLTGRDVFSALRDLLAASGEGRRS